MISKRKLKPAKNHRWIFRRACSNCSHWVADESDSMFKCRRSPEDIWGGWIDNEPEWHICDRWKGKDEPPQS